MKGQPDGSSDLNFERLVQEHYRGLYQFAFSLTRRENEASDLVQQTFYIWATKGHQLRDASKVKTWLFSTLHREFLKIRRHQDRFPHVELDQAGKEAPSISPGIINEMDGTTVVQALEQIDELYRAPLALFYLEEHSYKEIADILDVPIGTVQSRIARGKTQLQKALVQSDSNPSAFKERNKSG
jgi:RNA polymerase sigma factor (sigma-70 family)